ncbi:hypothetical protein ACG7TL_005900 [Trametes sanguinea]
MASYLSAAPDTLQQCSLICRQLLPASRGHLWRTVRLEVTERGLKSPRMESFLELLNDSPTIAWCVRRVIVKYQEDSLAGDATSDLTMATTLCRWFPNVRSLTLTNFRAPTFYDAISMARNLPTISFRLSKLLSDWPSSAEPSTAAPDGCWALRELAISGLLPAEEHSNLVAFLERSTEVVPIRSFAFCTPSVMFSPWPLSLELRPGIPSFAASLRHFGTSVSEITDTIQAYQPGPLRSLDFQYDCTAVFLSRLFLSNSVEPETISLPSFFIRELADVLSEPGAPPCPLLEEILLEVLAPHSWITTWEEDLGRLASALATQDAEGNRRYPNFARFSLRSSILHIIRPGLGRRAEEAAERQRNAEKSGLEMLEPFAKAGIKVELDIC